MEMREMNIRVSANKDSSVFWDSKNCGVPMVQVMDTGEIIDGAKKIASNDPMTPWNITDQQLETLEDFWGVSLGWCEQCERWSFDSTCDQCEGTLEYEFPYMWHGAA